MNVHGRDTDEARTNTEGVNVCVGPCSSVSTPPDEIAANGALSLLNLCLYLLRRQIGQQAEDFEQKGGFKERMFRVRQQHRRSS